MIFLGCIPYVIKLCKNVVSYLMDSAEEQNKGEEFPKISAKDTDERVQLNFYKRSLKFPIKSDPDSLTAKASNSNRSKNVLVLPRSISPSSSSKNAIVLKRYSKSVLHVQPPTNKTEQVSNRSESKHSMVMRWRSDSESARSDQSKTSSRYFRRTRQEGSPTLSLKMQTMQRQLAAYIELDERCKGKCEERYMPVEKTNPFAYRSFR